MRIPLKTALIAATVLAMAQPVAAQTVVRPGDDALTCPQMADEAATISASMGEQGPGLLGRAAGVARAGASLLVPGAGLALAGADALTGSGKDRKEAEADARRDRWNYLNGLYAGRGCGETAAQSPSAQPAQASVQAAAATAPATTPTTTPAPAMAAPVVAAPAISPASVRVPASEPH